MLSYFQGIHARLRQLLNLPTSGERARIARTARVVPSVREIGRLYHAAGVERLVRDSLWTGRSPERTDDALEWLYACRPERCLADAGVASASSSSSSG